MKAKVHNVTLFDRYFLIMARSKAGAKRDMLDILKSETTAEVATGQQIYEAGRNGQVILNLGNFANVAADQLELDGVEVGDADGETYDEPDHVRGIAQ